MSKWYISGGQSNHGKAQAQIKVLADRLGVELAQHTEGGRPISYWVSGTLGSYTRGTAYTAHIYAGDGSSTNEAYATANGLSLADVEGFIWAQGESGETDNWSDRLEALVGFIKEDYGIAGELYVVIPSIYSTTVDINNSPINDQLEAYVFNNPTTSAVVDAYKYTRDDTVHLNQSSAWGLSRELWKKLYEIIPNKTYPNIQTVEGAFSQS